MSSTDTSGEPDEGRGASASTAGSSSGALFSKNDPFIRKQSVILMSVVLAVFAATVAFALYQLLEPPKLADAPNTEIPNLYCVMQDNSLVQISSTPSSAAPSSSSARSSAPSSASPTAEPTVAPSSLSSDSSHSAIQICPAGTIRIESAPQGRGAFDPAARVTSILAVIMPLVTSFVAFYYGQKAGSESANSANSAETNRAAVEALKKIDNSEETSDLSAEQKAAVRSVIYKMKEGQ